ncbi:MAG: ABC transporter ATP-binding protein [Pseudomonadota bacterium]
MDKAVQRLRAVRRHVPLGVVALCFMLLRVSVALYLAVLAGHLAPHVLGLTEARSFITFELPIVVGLLLLYLVLGFASRYSTARLSEELAHSLRLRIHHHYLDSPVGPRDRLAIGERLKVATGGVDEFARFLSTVLPAVVPNLILLAGAFLVMWSVSPPFGIATAVLAPLALVLAALPRTIRGPGGQALLERKQRILRMLEEHLRLLPMIKSLGGEAVSARRFAHQSGGVKEIAKRHNFIVSLVEPAANAIAVGCVGIVAVLLCRGLVRGDIAIGEAMTFTIAAMLFVKAVRVILSAVRSYADIRNSAHDIFDAFSLESELPSSPMLLEPPLPRSAFARTLHFHRVGYSYEVGLPVLGGVDFSIAPGEFVAITGPNGAGKSTLLQLLLRFFDPTRGEIMIGDRPIQTYPIRELRRAVGYLPQRVELFADTVWNNVIYGAPDTTLAQVEEAAIITGLNEVVRDLPHRYDTVVGRDGIELSAGQAQRVALTRAIVRDTPILVLDEPSGPLDYESERLLVRGIRKMRPDRTLVLVTHRPSILELADRTLYLANGRLVDAPASTGRRGRLFSVG